MAAAGSGKSRKRKADEEHDGDVGKLPPSKRPNSLRRGTPQHRKDGGSGEGGMELDSLAGTSPFEEQVEVTNEYGLANYPGRPVRVLLRVVEVLPEVQRVELLLHVQEHAAVEIPPPPRGMAAVAAAAAAAGGGGAGATPE